MKRSLSTFARLLDDITRDAPQAERETRLSDFVELAARHGILHRMNAIFDEYKRIVRTREQLLHVLVRSAHELSEQEQQRFQKHMPKNVDLEFVRDASLKYGVQIQVHDILIESSLAGRLHRLSRVMRSS